MVTGAVWPGGLRREPAGEPVQWRITRNGSIATAVADTVGAEYELKISLGNEQIWSRRYGPDLRQLHQDAEEKLEEFLSFGWAVVPDALVK